MEAVSLEITPIDQKIFNPNLIQPQFQPNPTQKLDFSSPLTYTYLSNEQQSAIAGNFI